LRDLLIAISFANLCYLKVWWDLLAPRQPQLFFYDAPPAPVHYFAVILNVLLLGLLVWLLRPRNAYLLLMAIPLLALRNCVARVTPYVHPHTWLALYAGPGGHAAALVLLMAGLAGLFFALRHRQSIAPAVQGGLAMFFVVFPIFCAQSAWQAMNRVAWPVPPLHRLQPASAHRVVWIIFDELDYALSFVDRPKDLALPVFDRLASESLAATQAHPPAGRTNLSIPALLAGKFVSKLQLVGPADAEVTFETGTPPVSIRSLSQGKLPQAIVGWWFPYARIFGDSVHCEDCETEGVPFLYGSSFGTVMVNQMKTVLELEDRSPFGQSVFIDRFRGCYEFVMRHARERVADRAYSSVFIHVPAPHDPFFYDRKTGKPDRSNPGLTNYFDEVALADRAMGELREAMERAGVWDSSAVVVSGDHWYRAKRLIGYPTDSRVPFLVKLPGQKSGVAFDEPFNTVLTKELIDALENGTVTDAGAWLHDHRGNVTESPYNAN
jgi:hypothetical protein